MLAVPGVVFVSKQRVLVYYTTDNMHHERIVLAQAIPPNYYIVTPDADMYAEPLSTPPLSSLLQLGPGRALPPGIQRDQCYLMEDGRLRRDFSEQEVDVLAAEGLAHDTVVASLMQALELEPKWLRILPLAALDSREERLRFTQVR